MLHNVHYKDNCYVLLQTSCLSFPRASPFLLSISYDNTGIIICHYTRNIIRSAHIAIRTLPAYLPGFFYILNRSQFSQCLHLYKSNQTNSTVITQIWIDDLSIYRTFMFLIMIDNHKSYPLINPIASGPSVQNYLKSDSNQ